MKITIQIEGTDQNEIIAKLEELLEKYRSMTPIEFNLVGSEITKPLTNPLDRNV